MHLLSPFILDDPLVMTLPKTVQGATLRCISSLHDILRIRINGFFLWNRLHWVVESRPNFFNLKWVRYWCLVSEVFGTLLSSSVGLQHLDLLVQQWIALVIRLVQTSRGHLTVVILK